MDSTAASKSHSLFQVYLRLRPAQASNTSADRFLAVEPPATDAPSTAPTHIQLNPPNDRRRAIEKFCFTQVFEEDATQLDVFHSTGVVPLVEGVLAPHGGDGTDALLATLGVTGSGKSHTILGSRSQRGLTQLSLDVIFRSIGQNIVDCATTPSLEASVVAADASEAAIFTAPAFLETVYADMAGPSRHSSRAPTPMIVRTALFSYHPTPDSPSRKVSTGCPSGPPMPGMFPASPSGLYSSRHRLGSAQTVRCEDNSAPLPEPEMPPDVPTAITAAEHQHPWRPTSHLPGARLYSPLKSFMASTVSSAQHNMTTHAKHTSSSQGEHSSTLGGPPSATPRRLLNRPSAFPQLPDVSGINVNSDPSSEYVVLVSMYEVYNDRIFDLLTPPIRSAATKEYRRRPLLFKSTEMSSDRKVVAGLRKVICSTLQQALMVLEAGLHERRVAGTGSNSVSSRSHGFVAIEVKRRNTHHHHGSWSGNTLTVVDLAGSERARDAKTAGATLAEAGKINESLMYLGQCLQMQSDASSSSRPNLVPFRQCKLTELLFSNSFPSASMPQAVRRNPQRAVMIVTADPHGDFNATSQILRYSALAREVTVPRIPSITQTIMAGNSTQMAGGAATQSRAGPSSPLTSPTLASASVIHHHRPFFPPGTEASASQHHGRTFSPCSNSSSSDDRITMEIAALEIARMSEEIDWLRASLEQESEKRLEAESHLLTVNDRMLELEQDIREECAAEFDQRLAVEMARWKASLEVEKERGEDHWDRKVEVLERLQVTVTDENGSVVDGDDAAAAIFNGGSCEDKENVLVENLAEENERMRREIMVLKRELTGRSPSKRKPLRERDDLPMCSSAVSTPGSVGSHNGGKKTRHSTSHRNSHVSTGQASSCANSRANSPCPDMGGDSIRRRMERLRVTDDEPSAVLVAALRHPSGASMRSVASVGSPKKMRKLSPKKWDVALDDDDLF